MSYVLLSDSHLGPLPAAESPAEHKKRPSNDHSHPEQSPLSQQMERNLRLFEILSSRSDIDHPVCSECTELLLSGLQQRQITANRERDAYAEFLKQAREGIPSDEEQRQARDALAAAKEKQKKALEELESLEAAKAAMEQEIAELDRDEIALEEEEESFWRERNEFDATLQSYRDERDSLQNRLRHDNKLLEALQRTNVYNDSFCIDHNGPFAMINGLRLGKLPDHFVEWPEINAAWGLCVLLLNVVAEKLEFRLSGYRLIPLGSASKIEKLEYPQGDQTRTVKPKVTTFELYCSGDLPLGLGFLHRGFDNAMVAFLECLRQVGEHVEQSSARATTSGAFGLGRKMPYKINKDRIGDVSIKLAGGIVLSLVPLYLICFYFRTKHPLIQSHRVAPLHNALSLGRNDFVHEWLDAAPGQMSGMSSISRICNQSNIQWRPNLVLRLDDANGGIGNVRGNILDFLFFAIQVGASIILPSFAARSKTDISALWDARSSFDTFFDEEHFITTLQSRCPQMSIYKPAHEEDLAPALPSRYRPQSMRTDIDSSKTVAAAVSHFNSWLSGSPQSADLSKMTLVNLERTLWDGPDTRSLPPTVRRDFGAQLRLQPNVRRLAATITYNLAQRFGLPIDPRAPHPPGAFLGAHLRTEQDAQAAGWLGETSPHATFDAQTDMYLLQAAEHGLRVIYAASGNADHVVLFAAKAWAAQGVNITSKSALLAGAERAELEALSWDQQALVDYEVLLRCSVFGGFVKSSFSYNLAVSRNAVLEDQGVSLEPFSLDPRRYVDMETVAFDDGRSKVWGKDALHEMKIPRGAWP
ncbi:hypothetical protein MBLNU459_g7791t1 [Dothideomycetes sp. NU459]